MVKHQTLPFQSLGQPAPSAVRAVAEMLGFHVSGFLAWLMWRGVYLSSFNLVAPN